MNRKRKRVETIYLSSGKKKKKGNCALRYTEFSRVAELPRDDDTYIQIRMGINRYMYVLMSS